MPTINQLSAVSSLTDADLFPIYSAQNGDARKAAISLIATYLQGKITSTDDKQTQYASPSATGFTVQINDANLSIWLVLTSVADYAAGTIRLPLLANCRDKQEILVTSTHAVTTLTVDGNGATVTGAPTTLTANQSFKLRFEGVMKTWYKID